VDYRAPTFLPFFYYELPQEVYAGAELLGEVTTARTTHHALLHSPCTSALTMHFCTHHTLLHSPCSTCA
jgi:hypothetical protein